MSAGCWGAPAPAGSPAPTRACGTLTVGALLLDLLPCPDARVWGAEIRLARLAADLGFDCLWSAEHHFNDSSFVPDNLQLMTYLTALCPGVDLGTAVVIVPWHDPLRVASRRQCSTC